MSPSKSIPAGDDYTSLLRELKERIRSARLRTAVAVNQSLVMLYWSLGRDILARQTAEGWGTRVIERLSADLRRDFPEMQGLSPRNLKYMRAFAEAYPDPEIVQQLVAQLPWGHNLRLLEALQDPEERIWYARQAIEYGWSRAVLEHQIESGLIRRQGKAITNFDRTLPKPQSDLAQQLIKDPYTFDFLGIGADVSERDLERSLIEHVRQMILELGKGFAFVGSQYQLQVGGQDYYIDLLFYHLTLRCFVVVELKAQAFKPEFAGKMNFYLSAVDDMLRHPTDAPSIGMILCKGKNAIVVEYALRDASKPMGVAEYRVSLPPQLEAALPTAQDLEGEFPQWEIVRMRSDIEHAVLDLARARGMTGDALTLRQVLGWIRGNGGLPEANGDLDTALNTMYATVHGADIDSDELQRALAVGTEFLNAIRATRSQTEGAEDAS
ncbi:YhcG family protein [Inquilinus sp.]|jgi:predicted nuclease of restriction endonuclease-like (RecB) superfamily|uniref:YhcG family protein n=1 Tax=Inquilinus sp. TaxID=1932117 RepID=UPI003784DE2B